MKILIIYAHPETKGHCSEILSQVKKNLRSKGKDFDVIDLYCIKYDPILHKEEHYTAGNRDVSAQNRKFQKMILDSGHLIFIYPIWWGSYPAILKGFFDRVLTSGFAYAHKDGRLVRLLKGKSATVFTTSGGPKVLYSFTGNAPKLLLKHIVLGYCGIKLKYYQFGSCYRLDEKRKMAMSRTINRALNRI